MLPAIHRFRIFTPSKTPTMSPRYHFVTPWDTFPSVAISIRGDQWFDTRMTSGSTTPQQLTYPYCIPAHNISISRFLYPIFGLFQKRVAISPDEWMIKRVEIHSMEIRRIRSYCRRHERTPSTFFVPSFKEYNKYSWLVSMMLNKR